MGDEVNENDKIDDGEREGIRRKSEIKANGRKSASSNSTGNNNSGSSSSSNDGVKAIPAKTTTTKPAHIHVYGSSG